MHGLDKSQGCLDVKSQGADSLDESVGRGGSKVCLDSGSHAYD